jgi:uncharacterized protein with FMN-binding domain
MRKVLFIIVLAVAGLLPLLRYHPAVTDAAQSVAAPGVAAPPVATAPPSPAPPETPAPEPSTAPPATAPPTTVPSSGAPSETAPPVLRARIVDGSKVDTEFGPVQVRATFSGGRMTDVELISEARERRSQRIAMMAAGVLRAEALRKQSAHLDTVSGATQTSEAYAQSLQAAIDAKGN